MANPNPNPTPTDHEISRALQTLIRESQTNPNPNPNNPNPKSAPVFNSFNDVVQHLQSKLGADLSHKLDFISSQIQLLFQPPQPPHVPKDHFALQQTPNYRHHHHHQQQQQQQQLHHHQQQQHHHHNHQQQQPSVSAFHSFPPPHQPHLVQPKPDGLGQFVPVSLPDPPPGKESAAPVKARRRGGPGGLNKLCSVSPELQTIVGQAAMPRTEIVKQLWAYIRKNNLQDPSNKRKIICNDELRVVFETDCTDMFKMNKLLAKHIGPLEPTKVSASKRQKVELEAEAKSPESGPSVKISEALANFFGVSEREMLQSEITRRIWEYINVNHLQDPRNSMMINCDEKLQEIFGSGSIPALGIPEVLARHHLIRRS